MSNPLLLVVGAGAGLGAAVARRFGREGYDVALVARSPDRLEELGRQLGSSGITAGWTAADITDEGALATAIRRFGEHAGRIDVLHFNPSHFRAADPLQLSPQQLLADVHLGAGALLTAVQAARPFLRAGSRITATGSVAADRPWHVAASLGVQKAALRNLVHSVDARLAPQGVRAVSLTVNGTLAPGTRFAPDLVAEALYAAATTADRDWRTEVPYDG